MSFSFVAVAIAVAVVAAFRFWLHNERQFNSIDQRNDETHKTKRQTRKKCFFLQTNKTTLTKNVSSKNTNEYIQLREKKCTKTHGNITIFSSYNILIFVFLFLFFLLLLDNNMHSNVIGLAVVCYIFFLLRSVLPFGLKMFDKFVYRFHSFFLCGSQFSIQLTLDLRQCNSYRIFLKLFHFSQEFELIQNIIIHLGVHRTHSKCIYCQI